MVERRRGFRSALFRRRVADRLEHAVLIAALCGAIASLAPARAGAASCVDVGIGSERYYNCLNQDLQRYVTPQSARRSARDTPLSVDSPASALGSYDQAAVQERLGHTLGTSIYEQRPARTYAPSPLITGARR